MSYTLDRIVPWGRSFQEYCRMFALSEKDLSGTILGCGDGPAAFNSQQNHRGGRIVSVDPLYYFSKENIARRIDETFVTVLEQTRQNQDMFIWKDFSDPDALGQARMDSMKTFLEDYDAGKKEKRYLDAALPSLPLESGSFTLALCSHCLFLYSQQLDLTFHINSLKEMLRCAEEVRVFPLVDLNGEISPHLEESMKALQQQGFRAERIPVDVHFQKGAHEMLVISAFRGRRVLPQPGEPGISG